MSATGAFRAGALAAALLFLAAACGDDDDTAATTTEAPTTTAGPTIEEAQAAFCDSASEYVQALDTYGGLLSDSEVTVGDVRAGADELSGARSSLEDAVTELQSAIERAQAEAASTTTVAGETTTSTSIPEVSDDAIQAVQTAETNLQDATEGADDSTPLRQAAIEVNSAAFQLQVAWAVVLSEAGCVDDPSAAQAKVASFTRALQTDLAAAGRYTGPVDGIYGPETIAAVQSLQADNGLPVTGLPDKATEEALQAELGSQKAANVAALQGILAAAGFYTGPIDGIWSPAVEDAIRTVQTEAGLPATGQLDPATMAYLVGLIQGNIEPTTTTASTTTTSAETTSTTAAATTTT
jgi:peptidoglycan hydrolase-like protein with peptidoglycan-binding domain